MKNKNHRPEVENYETDEDMRDLRTPTEENIQQGHTDEDIDEYFEKLIDEGILWRNEITVEEIDFNLFSEVD